MYFEACLQVFRGYSEVLLCKYKCFLILPRMKDGASSSKYKKKHFSKPTKNPVVVTFLLKNKAQTNMGEGDVS